MNLATAAGQRQHYAAIRARLNRPMPSVVQQRIGAREIYVEPAGPALPKGGCLRYAYVIGPGAPEKDAFASAKASRRIVLEVCAKHNQSPSVVMARCRQTRIVRCRWEIMWRLRRETNWSLLRIADFFACDHTTVMNGLLKHEQLISDPVAPLTMTDIGPLVRRIAAQHGLSPILILERQNHHTMVVAARYQIFWEMHRRGMMYSAIAKVLRFDESTVRYGAKEHLRRLAKGQAA